jgi:Sec-independent protein translocase protein TatA
MLDNQWADYGLAGLIILGLLYLLKFGFVKFESVVNTFSSDFKDLQKDHREDRKDWHEAIERKSELEKQSQERRDLALSQALNDLTVAIKEQNGRKRNTDN